MALFHARWRVMPMYDDAHYRQPGYTLTAPLFNSFAAIAFKIYAC